MRSLASFGAAAALALAATAASPSFANATLTKSASLAGVRATLRIQPFQTYGQTHYRLTRLAITRNGTIAFDGALPADYGETWAPTLDTVLAVRELDADNSPEVIVELYSGGAHCCVMTAIYGYDSAKHAFVPITTDWRSAGYLLKTIDSERYPVFFSEDDRFAYKYASYAGSGRPLSIYRYRDGRLHDVTFCYPQLIAADAKQFWQAAVAAKTDPNAEPNGVLAPYVADEYLLGNGDAAMRKLAAFPSANAKFVADLRAFLKQTGYIGGHRPDCSK